MGFNVKKILSSRPMQGNPGKFYMWNPESLALESRIHLRESGIALMIEIQNPGPTYKDWKPVPGI